MRLSGNFFTSLSVRETEGGFERLIRLEPDNVIFNAHFPDYPITPGAVQIRVATELLEEHLGRPLILRKVSDLKFQEPLFPGAEVEYSFTEPKDGDDGLKVGLTVRSEEKVFSRMSLVYAPSCTVILRELRVCVIVPVYNNAGTVRNVVERALRFCEDVIVVDDGSTDGSSDGLEETGAVVVRYERNRGKGYALRTGFREASRRGFERAITIDADGQHFPEDIPLFAKELKERPDAMLVGSRDLRMENMPEGNTFANKFSNFWFRLQTGVRLPDTQSGFRLYQLRRLGGLHLLTSRYEAELELLVFQCWKGVETLPVGIRVHYPPEGERVTHFRPFRDFFRISVLNTVLCVLALVYGRPSRLLRRK